MQVRITKTRLAAAGLLLLAGIGLGSLLSPLVGSALATAGQIVNVSDPVNANTAKVDSAGKLYVGDGSGRLSVDGTVESRPAAPASPWRARVQLEAGNVLIAGPSTVPINVTSLSVSTDAPSGSGINVFLFATHVPSSATNCSLQFSDGGIWQIRDIGDGVTPVSFTFPTPLQFKPPANTKGCLYGSEGTSAVVATMNAVGFYGG
jgi:hypothetical protein